jgi:hypothetical protein
MKAYHSLLSVAFFIGIVGTGAQGQTVWVQHGPGPTTNGQCEGITGQPVVGAVKSVAAHPTDPSIMFIGAVGGGIWRTGNATAANPAWVQQLALNESLSIGAIEYDPTDAAHQTLLAGSGSFSSFGVPSALVGVFRTTNDGANWTRLDGGGTIANQNITGVAPRGATLVISTTNGVFRSTNTGAIWTQISGVAGTGLPAGASFDLAGDPTTSTRLYTNAGSNGIYRSNDTGGNWTKVSNATVDAALASVGNVKMSVGMSNNLYVAIVRFGQLFRLFRFDNGTSTWATLDLPSTNEAGGGPYGIHPGGQGGTHLSIAADRTNANICYIGGDRQPAVNEAAPPLSFPNTIGANDFSGRLFRIDATKPAGSQSAHITHSNTAGNSAPHADSRDMAIDANGDLVETDDGGVYKRTTPLTNTGDWASLNGDLEVTELHDVAWDSRSKVAVGAAQDTGSPQQMIPGQPKWFEESFLVGDGGDIAIDDTGTPGSSIRYQAAEYLQNFVRSTYDTSNTFVSRVFPAFTLVGGGTKLVAGQGSAPFVTPVIVNNVTPARLLIGGFSIYESSDQGDTVAEVGAGIQANSGAAIAYGAAGNADMVYAGVGDNVRIRNTAAPAAFTASATYPGAGTFRPVQAIAIDRGNPLRAFVADATHVYLTKNGGGAWTEITGNLLTLTPGNLLSIAFSTANTDGSVIAGGFNGAYIARGPAFDTWKALGTGLPRVPVFDLEYDPADKVLVAGTMGRGAWTVSLDERTAVDVALVLDLSGSMLAPACASGCDSRLQVLKDSVELFTQLWTIFAIPDDRMALNYFRTTINELTPGGVTLFPFSTNASGLITNVQSQATVATNLTAMGGGIQTAINRLTDNTRPRNIIVFTDGMQNVNPMVNTKTFEIADQPGHPASGVPVTVPPTVLNATLGRKVSTIGIGSTAPFVDLLSNIAAQTNGLFKLTTAPDEDLRRFFVEQLIDTLRVFSPQLVAYRYGSAGANGSSEDFTTNASARKVVLKLSWKRGANLDFTVMKDGVPIVRAGHFITGPFYKIFTIDVPAVDALGHTITAAGTWRMNITGKAAAPYEAAAIIEEAKLEYKFSIAGMDHVAGAPLPLNVQVRLGTLPITDATVTARVLVPKQGLGTLLAKTQTPSGLGSLSYEPAASDAQRKYELVLRDPAFFAALRPAERNITLTHTSLGNYSASFTDTGFAGPYTVIYTVTGSRPEIGDYRRTESQSVSVRFNEAVLPASTFSIVQVGRTAGGRLYDLLVLPVDGGGNFLGPDYGDRITATVDGTPVQGPPVDRLDGSYVFRLTAPDPTANVTVTVMDKPLYNGPLGGIPVGSGGTSGTFALSAHAGVTFPSTGFASNARDGFLLEIDLERRLTSTFSIEGVLGHYDFGPAPAINGFTLFAKRYYPSPTPWRGYLALGLGAYKPQSSSTKPGASAALGINRAIGARTEFDAGVVFTRVFSNNTGWLGLRAGFKVTF